VKIPAGILNVTEPLFETEAASVKRVAPSNRYTFLGVVSAETPILCKVTAVTVPAPLKVKLAKLAVAWSSTRVEAAGLFEDNEAVTGPVCEVVPEHGCPVVELNPAVDEQPAGRVVLTPVEQDTPVIGLNPADDVHPAG